MALQEEAISKADFGRLCRLIYEQSGIVFSPDKKTMLELRIKRRLNVLNLQSYAQYCEYLFARQGRKDELVHLIDVVTTNKTDFFREPHHFEVLVKKALPEVLAANESGKPTLVWSAACSSGEEPYTLAIVLNEYAQKNRGFRFRVMATDISTTVLEKAQTAVYNLDVVAPVVPLLQRKYFMRSRDPNSKVMRVVPELRQIVEFRRLNFMDNDYGMTEKAHVVFCRNALIYFDRPTQESILKKLVHHLVPGGYLFVGHSESLNGLDVGVAPVAPTVYRKPDGRS